MTAIEASSDITTIGCGPSGAQRAVIVAIYAVPDGAVSFPSRNVTGSQLVC
jgi:hypothetical protein